MLRLKWYLFFILSVCLTHHIVSYAEQQVDVSVCLINHSQSDCVFHSPVQLRDATDIDSITLTFKNLDITVNNESSYTADKWGVSFNAPGAVEKFYCNQIKCGNDDIEIDANNQDTQVITTGDPGKQINHITGMLVITLSRFKNGMLPTDLQSLIQASTNGNIIVNATYSDSSDNTDGTKPRLSGPYNWQSDEGTLKHAPILSALARVNGLVINIKPPSDLSSLKQNTESPPVLVDGSPGHVTGYLIALWLARDLSGFSTCGSGNWFFSPNPISYYNSGLLLPSFDCLYQNYEESLMGVGGHSTPLLCPSSLTPSPLPPSPDSLPVSSPPYLKSSSYSLTQDIVAIPSIFPFSTKVDFLKNLIDHPVKEQDVPGTCYKVVYVPASQTSYGKQGVAAGEVYGVTAWTINAAYTTTDHTPNLSLSHSNIGFMTATDSSLASLEKDSALKLTKADCFVATAASGDINSNTVFYWRILRDEYLRDLGVTKFYYKYGPRWAYWLNEHPEYKSSVNFILEKSGAFFYFSTLYSKKASTWISDTSKPVIKQIKKFFQNSKSALYNLWEQEASANEESTYTDDTWAYNSESNAEPDESIKIGHSVNFDFAFSGGVLFPLSDKDLYKKYYPHLTLDYELSSSAIIWTSNFGWSIGLKGSYGYNTEIYDDHTLGESSQTETRYLYLGTAEIIVGARYRNINFLLLQPGVFVGAGVLRLREEDRPKEDSGQNGSGDVTQTLGVTQFSPVFDLGANLDISLSTLFMYSERELALSRDILLRLTAIYKINPSRALSGSGLVLNAGFAFLF